MQSPRGITASAFWLKCFKLLFVAVLSAIILIGCEGQLLSPLKEVPEPPTNTQFAQMALSDLADTATKHGLMDLANAASGLAEVLAIEDGISVQPTFSRLTNLAQAVTVLEQAWAKTGCSIELRDFAQASVDAVRSYTIRDAADMELSLQNLAQEALNAKTGLQQLPAENPLIPFAFGYGPDTPATTSRYAYHVWDWDQRPAYELGVILIQYDSTTRPASETWAAVIEFLALKGYKIQMEGVLDDIGAIDLGADVDPLLIMEELISIPSVALVQPNFYFTTAEVPPPPPLQVEIINRVRTLYNGTWCQGSDNLDIIDDILRGIIDGILGDVIDRTLGIEDGLDFFDYSFILNLVDIYAEEIPEAAERIQMKEFSVRSIAIEFLGIYFEHSEKSLDEIIEIFRQSVRNGHVSIDHATIKHYYHWYWNK